MVPGEVPFKSVSDSPALHSRWLLLLKIEISSIVHCCFSINQNELKFNCSYMAMSSLTYILLTWFSIWHLKLIENGGVTHHFESGPPKDHFSSNFWAKDFDVIFIS
jgi:hypothetical protein